MTDHDTTANSEITRGALALRHVHTDAESRALASEFFMFLIGTTLADLRWDDRHHLQGHGRVNGRELVVIAPRDDCHRTVVLTSEDWDAVSHANGEQRCRLLASCAIADHDHLVAAL